MKEDVILIKLEEVVKEVRDIKSDIEVKLNQYIVKTDNVIKILNNEINEVKKTTNELEKSQNFLSTQFEPNKSTMDNVLKSHSSITKENQIPKQRITLLEKQLKAESIKRNDLEQHGRLDQVKINGIPMTDNESCKEITVKIANLCKAKISISDIDVAHRLPGGGIIVKFKSRNARDELYYAKKQSKGMTVKDLGLSPPLNKGGKPLQGYIFINEGLTQENKSWLFETRKKCRELNIKHVWTNKGKIRVKGEHHDKPILIKSMDDVNALS